MSSQKPGAQKNSRQSKQAESDADARASQKLQQEYLSKIAGLKEEQQLQLATLKSTAQQQVDRVHQHYQIQLNQMKETVAATQRMLAEEKRRGLKLKDKLATQTSEFQRAREQLLAEFSQQQAELNSSAALSSCSSNSKLK